MAGSLSKQSLHLKDSTLQKRRRLVPDVDFTTNGTMTIFTGFDVKPPYQDGQTLTFNGGKLTNAADSTVVNIPRNLWSTNDFEIDDAEKVTVSEDWFFRIRFTKPYNLLRHAPMALRFEVDAATTGDRVLSVVMNNTGKITYKFPITTTTLLVPLRPLLLSGHCDCTITAVVGNLVIKSIAFSYVACPQMTRSVVTGVPPTSNAILMSANVHSEQDRRISELQFKLSGSTFLTNIIEPEFDATGIMVVGFRVRAKINNATVATVSLYVQTSSGVVQLLGHTLHIIRGLRSGAMHLGGSTSSSGLETSCSLDEDDYIYVTPTSGFASATQMPSYSGSVVITTIL
jgi:hypothetical protein